MRIRHAVPTILLASLSLAACSEGGSSPFDALASSSAIRGSSSGAGGDSTTARIRLIAMLAPPASSPFRGAKGKVKWDARASEGKWELEMEIEHLPPATAVEFFFDGVSIGKATTNLFGEAEVELETEDGHSVPTSVAGRSGEVRTAAGAVIVSGGFPAP